VVALRHSVQPKQKQKQKEREKRVQESSREREFKRVQERVQESSREFKRERESSRERVQERKEGDLERGHVHVRGKTVDHFDAHHTRAPNICLDIVLFSLDDLL